MADFSNPEWQNSMKIKIDYNNLSHRTIGSDDGLSKEMIGTVRNSIKKCHQEIVNKTGKGKDFLGFLDLPNTSQDLLDEIKKEAKRISESCDKFINLGIGGSYLGSKALVEALNSPYHNELSREKRNNKPKIYFEGNNLDSDSLSYLLDLLPDNKPEKIEDKFSLGVISKSGGTIETAVAFRLLKQKVKDVYGDDQKDHITAVTDKENGKLREIVNKEGYRSFIIPNDVGGRYSVLTPVGLLPAAVAGIDIDQLMAGAKYMKEQCSSDDLFENPAYLYAALQYNLYDRGKKISIMAIWSKALEYLGFWYDQLCAESIGKEGIGRTPITTVNTRDLHARGQQIQEGEKNTFITNIFVEKSQRDISVPKDEDDLDKLNYLEGKNLNSMLKGAMDGTNYAYTKDKRASLNIMVPELNAFTMGQLFYFFELATLMEGYLLDVNPLDQPGVEAYKKFMFGNLGREDMKEYKEEFDNRVKPIDQFIL